MTTQITLSPNEHYQLILKLVRYEAALRVISTVGVDAYTDIEGWSQLTKIAQRTALRALEQS